MPPQRVRAGVKCIFSKTLSEVWERTWQAGRGAYEAVAMLRGERREALPGMLAHKRGT